MSNALRQDLTANALIITFNRPSIRSPLSVFVIEELQDIVAEAASMPAEKRLIFTGSEDVFASGADLHEIARVDKNGAGDFAKRGQRLMNAIAALQCKTLAAINGYCFGGALDLALACDGRIASPKATFAHPGARLGIITGWSGTQRLPRLVGEGIALEMFFTASPIDAVRALRVGLVDTIVDNPLAEALSAGSR